MNKRVKKLLKRVLMWVVGLPVALVITSVIMDTVVPEKYGNQFAEFVLSPFFDFDKIDKEYKAMDMLAALGKRQEWDSLSIAIDSLETTGTLPPVMCNFHRAAAYAGQNQHKLTEFYLRKSMESFSGSDEELYPYAVSARRLAQMLQEKHDYEGALKVLMPAIATISEHESYLLLPTNSLSNLYSVMGESLVAMGRFDEGEHQFQEALEAYKRNKSRYDIGTDFTNDTSYYDIRQQIAESASQSYLNKGVYDRSATWLKESKATLRYLQEHCDSAWNNFGSRLFRQQLTEARLLAHQGKTEEAEKLFSQCLASSHKKSGKEKREMGQYLLDTQQWQEAIDMYQKRDSNDITSTQTTLDDITQALVPQYSAWRSMGNTPKAIAMADSITSVLDSAVVRWRNSDAMELATIYDTQGKEAQIAQKQAALTRLWWIGTMIVLGLVILSFIIYTIYRRRITKMQAVQERIESELRIARDIQMSMVPSIFPEREGLDMYASMTPAKEVGGDLYGYLLMGDKLYFAVGDVSGKGVPASLFMAQATRLFLTLAKQGMMPAEICTRINDALSGDDNESGMFVTFWLGLVDLSTGRLNFCNAGHNPPVIGGGQQHGEFLDMIPNAPIGLWPGLEYEGEEIDSIKGRPLFIYTDGLNEAENPQQEQFGDDRMLEFLRHTHFDTAQQVIEALKAEVEAHRNGADPNDDLTMMCLRV